MVPAIKYSYRDTDNQTTFSSGASSSSATATGQSKESTASLQISGKVVNENDYVRLGAFHTLDLEANRDFRLTKTQGWDSVALERVEDSTKEGRGAEVGAIVCGEGELPLHLSNAPLLLVLELSSSILQSYLLCGLR